MKRNNAKSRAHALSMFNNMLDSRTAMRAAFETHPPGKQKELREAAILAAMRCDFGPKEAMTRALNEYPVNHWGNETRHLKAMQQTTPHQPNAPII